MLAVAGRFCDVGVPGYSQALEFSVLGPLPVGTIAFQTLKQPALTTKDITVLRARYSIQLRPLQHQPLEEAKRHTLECLGLETQLIANPGTVEVRPATWLPARPPKQHDGSFQAGAGIWSRNSVTMKNTSCSSCKPRSNQVSGLAFTRSVT